MPPYALPLCLALAALSCAFHAHRRASVQSRHMAALLAILAALDVLHPVVRHMWWPVPWSLYLAGTAALPCAALVVVLDWRPGRALLLSSGAVLLSLAGQRVYRGAMPIEHTEPLAIAVSIAAVVMWFRRRRASDRTVTSISLIALVAVETVAAALHVGRYFDATAWPIRGGMYVGCVVLIAMAHLVTSK